jgi:cytochrome c553
MEKMFFAIVRWFLMFILLLALLTFIGTGIYAIKLYLDTQNTSVEYKGYEQKVPTVDASNIIQDYKDKDNIKKEEFEKIKKYVVSVMENGSSGHGYSKGDMPGNLIKDKNVTKQVAAYVASGLKEPAPTQFVECVTCHGYDGKGMYGEAPNLKELPIYYKKRLTVLPSKKEVKIEEKKIEQKPVKSDFDKALDLISTKINEYAKLVQQGEVNRDKLGEFLSDQFSTLTKENQQQYTVQLLQAFDELIEFEKSLLKKNKKDTSYKRKSIIWLDFLIKFTDKFHTAISDERMKEAQYEAEYEKLVSEKIEKAAAAKIQLFFVLQVLFAALGTFILLTMMLVLLKIESNTRYCSFIQKPTEELENES